MTIPHHGSKTSSTPAFIHAVHPRYAIATVGYLNHYHHPRADILQRYQASQAKTLRSDWDGAVMVDFPASRQAPQIRAWRNEASRYWQDRPGN
jgi:competence protein ComEC